LPLLVYPSHCVDYIFHSSVLPGIPHQVPFEPCLISMPVELGATQTRSPCVPTRCLSKLLKVLNTSLQVGHMHRLFVNFADVIGLIVSPHAAFLLRTHVLCTLSCSRQCV
jgi:hypothetical protein